MPVPNRSQVSLLVALLTALAAISAGIPEADPLSLSTVPDRTDRTSDSRDNHLGAVRAERPIPPLSSVKLDKTRAVAPQSTEPTTEPAWPISGADSASLDTVPLRSAGKIIEQAIARAQTERSLRISPGLVDRLVDQGNVQVIVSQPNPQAQLGHRLAQTRHTQPQYFRYIPFAALQVGPQALLNLIESHDVLGIEEDRTHRPSLATSVALISGDIAQEAGFDGSGQAIAILDTGIDSSHPAFAGRMLDEACFSRLGHCPNGESVQLGPGAGAPCNFNCDHGTLVAGAALALDPEGSQSGVAPDAGIISLMVYSEYQGEPAAFMSDIIAGLEHIYGLRDFYDIAAVNLSLGGQAFDSEQSCDEANAARKAIIDLLRNHNIATIVASGNDGHPDLLTEPACVSSAIAVGATTKTDSVSSFSNSASFLAVLAPGQRIRTTRIGGGFALASGTSIATPHVAGAWAALREAYPDRSVSEILFALQSTGQPLIDPRNTLTFPRIDVASALETLEMAEPDASSESTESPAPAEPDPPPQDRCGLIGIEVLLAGWIVRFRRRKNL